MSSPIGRSSQLQYPQPPPLDLADGDALGDAASGAAVSFHRDFPPVSFSHGSYNFGLNDGVSATPFLPPMAAAGAAAAVVPGRQLVPPPPSALAAGETWTDAVRRNACDASHICQDTLFAKSDELKMRYTQAIESVLALSSGKPQKAVEKCLSTYFLYNKETILALHGLYTDLNRHHFCPRKYDIATRQWVDHSTFRGFPELVKAALFPNSTLGPQWHLSNFSMIPENTSKTREEWLAVANSFPSSPSFDIPPVSAAAPNVEAIYRAAPLPQERTFLEKIGDFFTAVWDAIANFFNKCFGKENE